MLKPREMVECRFYGDRKWYPSRVTKVYASGLSDLRLEDGSQEHQWDRHMVRKSSGGEFMDSNNDEGMYESGDWVEVKLAGSPWQQGRVISVNSDGYYDVQFDNSVQEDNVAGRWLRHYFRPDQPVEVRPNGQNIYLPAIITSQDGNGFFSVRFQDGTMESTINPRRIFPADRGFIFRNALMFEMEKMGMSIASDGGGGGPAVMRSRFEMGDRVESCRNGGSWYAGRISFVHNNDTYDINYLDGGNDMHVPGNFIRLSSPNSGGRSGRRFRSPKRVVFMDEQEKGVMGAMAMVPRNHSMVLENQQGMKMNGEHGNGGMIPSQSDLILSNRSRSPAAGNTIIADKMAEVAVSNNEELPNEGARSIGFHHGDLFNRSYKEGMRVEARYHGQGAWFPGFISRVNPDGTYDISFDYNEVWPSLSPEVIRPFSMGEQHFYGGMRTMNTMNSMDGFQEPFPSIEPFNFNGYGGAHSNRSMNCNKFGGYNDTSNGNAFGSRSHVSPSVLRKGLKVQVQMGGDWRPGRISRVHPQGVYDIMMDNGAQEASIPRQNIRYAHTAGRLGEESGGMGGSFLFRPDMMVEARLRGSSKYYPGFIHGCHPDGTYDVCFQDGTTEMGIKQNMIRPHGYMEMMAREAMADGSFALPGMRGMNSIGRIGYEYCSGFYGSMVFDGYGYDSMKRNSEREFRGHPSFTSYQPTKTGFGVYHPREVYSDQWCPMITYVYDAFQEYYYRYQFQTKNPGLDSRHGLNKDAMQLKTPGYLPPGCELTIIPCCEWCDFSGGEPTLGRIVWNGWRVSCPFFFRVRQGCPRNFTMKVMFYVRAVVVCEVAMDMYYDQGINEDMTMGGRGMSGYRTSRYSRIMRDGDDMDLSGVSAGRGMREEFDRWGAMGSGAFVDVRKSMFRNVFMIQMENDEGYEVLMAETVEAVPGITIRRRDNQSRTSPMYLRSADRVQFAVSRDGGQVSSDMSSDFRAVQSILITPEERAQKILLTFSDLPMVFPQSTERLPACNFSFCPEVNLYRWQYQAKGRPQMFLRQRLYEASRAIFHLYSEVTDRPVPFGMLLLPAGNDFYNYNNLTNAVGMGQSELESSMWNLFFLCEDHTSQTMRDEFCHPPIEMRFDAKFMVDAYPLLKATVAVLMYCRLTYKDNIPFFPTPFNVYGLSKRFDENMLIEMSNFYDDQAMRWAQGFGVGMGSMYMGMSGYGDMEGYGNAMSGYSGYGPMGGNMMSGSMGDNMGGYGGPGNMRGPRNNMMGPMNSSMNGGYPPATPLVSRSFDMSASTPFAMAGNNMYSSSSAPTLKNGMTGGPGNGSDAYPAGRYSDHFNRQRLMPNVDFLLNCVECAEFAVASLQNWSQWRSARRVRSHLDQFSPNWLQQCDMRPIQVDLKTWWVSPMAYDERWKYVHWMINGPNAPTYVSPGPGGLGELHTPSPVCGFFSVLSQQQPMAEIATHLMGELGIKDNSSANEIALRLSQEGFETWDDVLRMDAFIDSRGDSFEDIKWFMCDLGIPMIYSTKIMNCVRSNRNRMGYSQ